MSSSQPPHSTDPAAFLADVATTVENGLTQQEVKQTRKEVGENKIEDADRRTVLSIFIEQFQDYLVYILIAGGILSVAIGLVPGEDPHWAEAGIITLIVVGNGLFGFYQDYQAERQIISLAEITAPNATVKRDGEFIEIDAKEVVPGDVIKVQTGDSVPADARVIEAQSLSTSEAALTGESTQVAKTTAAVDPEAPVAERTNMIFKGTDVVRGSGVAVVTRTGMETEIGQIAEELQEAETQKTPFQQEVDRLGRQLAYVISGFVLVLALIQAIITGADALTIILLAIALVVAAIPEALPVIVTFALALGAKRLAAKDAAVRRLPVVESLGSVNYILTDKTGTLTTGDMTVEKVYHDGQELTITGGSTDRDGEFLDETETAVGPDAVAPTLECGVYASDAEIDDQTSSRDPTERALLDAGRKGGVTQDLTVQHELSFSSNRKRMTVIGADNTAYMKGAPDTVIDRCSQILKDGSPEPMTDADRTRLTNQVTAYAENGLRVIAFARKVIEESQLNQHELDPDDIETDMVFLGLQAMIDPPRTEVKDAIDDCRTAGIAVVMATGDDPETAKAIGETLGFDSGSVITGDMIESMSDDELAKAVASTEIFARVSPEHKVTILKALQAQDYYVAMTGDGVNDAPALKNSDVGVAMGQRGTDVAKQSSDIILLDDNFVTIRDAIKEGRTIFDNIRKVTNYLLSTNAVEVMLVFLGAVVTAILYPGLFDGVEQAAVLSALMILWVNFMTDGPPAIGLVLDRSIPEIMQRPPRDPGETIIDTKILSTVMLSAVLGVLLFLPVFFLLATGPLGTDIALAQTVLFTVLVLFELVMVQVIRREYGLRITSNRWLLAGLVGAFLIHLIVLYTPLGAVFTVASIGLSGWILSIVPVAVFVIGALVVQNLLRRYVGSRQNSIRSE